MVKILPPSISRSVDGSQSERVAIKLELEVFRGLAMFEQAENRDNKRRDKDKDANGVIATSKYYFSLDCQFYLQLVVAVEIDLC